MERITPTQYAILDSSLHDSIFDLELQEQRHRSNDIANTKKGESTMAKKNIQWLESLDEAQNLARKNGKLILLDFFNPG